MSDHQLANGYEFDDNQNRIIADLAGKMTFVSLMLMTLGFFVVLGAVATLFLSISEGFRTLVVGVVFFLLGIWTRTASKSLREIVDTEGQDIPLLMNAMEQFRLLYSLQYWACLVAIILLVAALGVQLIS